MHAFQKYGTRLPPKKTTKKILTPPPKQNKIKKPEKIDLKHGKSGIRAKQISSKKVKKSITSVKSI